MSVRIRLIGSGDTMLLLLLVVLTSLVAAQKARVLNAEKPTFWPPWESSPGIVDQAAYDKLDIGLRRMIEFGWTKAIYDSKLERASRKCTKPHCFQLIPVYFWPGQRVDLRCLMSRRAYTSNGHVKKWRVLHQIDMMDAFEERKWSSLKWKTLSEVARASAVYEDYMPTTMKELRSIRVLPRFFQRDGFLIIQQASPGIQGIYNCYDDQLSDNRDVLYAVMAMTPYIHLKGKIEDGRNSVKNLDGRCPHMMRKDDLKGKQPVFAMPDLNWQWTFIPTLYWERGVSHPRAMRSPNTPSDLLRREVRIAKHLEPEIDKRLNLLVRFAWSAWSPCTACAPNRGRRSREGHCYLKKAIPYQRIDAYTYSDIERHAEHTWLLQLDKLLDTAPFDRDGIRVHSSLLVTLSSKKMWKHHFSACDGDPTSYAHNFWYALFEVFNVLGRRNATGHMNHSISEQYRMCVDGYFVENTGIWSHWEENSQSYYVTGYFFDLDECSEQCS